MYLPLAGKLAARYATAHEVYEDLVQVAAVGLIGAIDRFDPDRGVSFASFAVPTILGELKRHFRNTGWSVHVARGGQELGIRVEKASQTLVEQTGRSPRVDELAQYLELSIEDVLTGLEAHSARFSSSLDVPISDAEDDAGTLMDTLGGIDDRYGLVETKLSLRQALQQIRAQEAEVLRLRMETDLTQAQIADRLGCSQMNISRILRRASTTLQTLMDPALTSSKRKAG
ncbi:MAG TPA: sigma-70 family RNA polymerase sigma factor [Solirubrobacteraceae bacterium]|jgi:RNA polymerase sigma-B factor|nr:sigma-70 family RNA polymerase sigma factor [Solirubrobacteraceae bacterium]